jgi:hypothetical protein
MATLSTISEENTQHPNSEKTNRNDRVFAPSLSEIPIDVITDKECFDYIGGLTRLGGHLSNKLGIIEKQSKNIQRQITASGVSTNSKQLAQYGPTIKGTLKLLTQYSAALEELGAIVSVMASKKTGLKPTKEKCAEFYEEFINRVFNLKVIDGQAYFDGFNAKWFDSLKGGKRGTRRRKLKRRKTQRRRI